ncbi:RsmB/NOP family class I SAM-dependent RNA methyltransferase [Nocardioides campestrisoli]|uniref:RsmB/NOP family class I SAM-dependent RNA methyltransferase n=1 Tax=Nocardioides campestrisoli TaxID=2736757 RepID=UPI00163D63FC|nr:transcription antitermination factor NusB [Nocardioides campestrisoli]
MADPRQSRGRRPGGRPPRARKSADPSRRAALEVLTAVRVDDAYTNLVLPSVLRTHGLTGRDAAFTTELVSGTLRRRATYDAVIAACLDRPLAKVQAKVLDALRLGAHQLLSMRVPSHAAISSTVDLVRDAVGQGAAGFANAVLRRVCEEDLAGWVRRVAPDPVRDPHGFSAVAHSHPRWVVDALGEALARSPRTEVATTTADELQALLAADNEAPAVCLVARPGRVDRAELPGTPTLFSPYGVVLDGGDPGEVPAVAQGRAGVQDEGSQLVALALARVGLEPGPEVAEERWLDLCAGPGGKSALLAALAATRDGSAPGARLLSVERQPHRARLVRRALDGADGSLGVVTADGTQPAWPAGSFDRVQVDVPCTGLGALRRRPESRWRRSPEDLEALVPLQRALLDRAVDAVRPGGVVLYSTCSPVLAETADVVSAVLAERDDVRLGDLSLVLPEVPDAAGPLPGTMQLWPHRHRTDAMFMALLERTS